MSTEKERTWPRGTIFKFPGYRGYFILAESFVPDREFYYNLICLSDGNRKTRSWPHKGHVDSVIIPEETWENGGPPILIYKPKLREDEAYLNIIKNSTKDEADSPSTPSLNKEVVKQIARVLIES